MLQTPRHAVLESKHKVPRGISEAGARIEREEKDRLKSASLIFKRNAVPPGEGAREGEGPGRCSPRLSVQVSSAGQRDSPQANLHESVERADVSDVGAGFCRKLETRQAILAAVDTRLREPPRSKPPSACKPHDPCGSFAKDKPLVFEGLAVSSIHRPGPEHFWRISTAVPRDGRRVPLRVSYGGKD